MAKHRTPAEKARQLRANKNWRARNPGLWRESCYRHRQGVLRERAIMSFGIMPHMLRDEMGVVALDRGVPRFMQSQRWNFVEAAQRVYDRQDLRCVVCAQLIVEVPVWPICDTEGQLWALACVHHEWPGDCLD